MNVFTLVFLRVTIVLPGESPYLNVGMKHSHVNIHLLHGNCQHGWEKWKTSISPGIDLPQSNDGYGSVIHATLGIRIAKTNK